MVRIRRSSLGIVLGAVAVIGATEATTFAQAKQWSNLSGQIVWDGPPPKQQPIVVGVDKNVCAKDRKPLEEDYLINPKNKGLKDVFIWIAPTGAAKGAPFPVADIHPALVKPAKPEVEIDIPCCRFIPHVLAAREGQKLTIKNSAPIAHSASFQFHKNLSTNKFISAGEKFELSKPFVAEPTVISVACGIHPWMIAYMRVFDHPYYAVTDEDGKFEIPSAPVGNYSLFIQHARNGWLDGVEGRKGKAMVIAPGGMKLGEFKMKLNSN